MMESIKTAMGKTPLAVRVLQMKSLTVTETVLRPIGLAMDIAMTEHIFTVETSLTWICPTYSYDDGDCGTVDADGDGFTSDVDCNDGDPAINPNATEIPADGIDQDCDGIDPLCAANETLDCNGTCAPSLWLGDGYCDDGTSSPIKAIRLISPVRSTVLMMATAL